MTRWSGIFILIAVGFISSCEESEKSPPILTDDEVIQIPVVVHVLYSREDFNISAEKIASQLTVLNQDFRAQNPDRDKTPAEFKNLIADVGIEFKLASLDPEGKPTTGITRTRSDLQGWDGFDGTNTVATEELKLYYSSAGGADIWPTDRYLNIYVVEMSDRLGRVGLPGYSHFPGTDPRIDAVVIDPRVFGTMPPITDEHSLGRTATHEIGHWLNLHHIFGTGQDCNSTDFVEDTPPVASRYLGNPSYPQFSCGQSSMFMNFMDYVNDDAMHLFTKGQRERMRAVFLPNGARYKLYQHITER